MDEEIRKTVSHSISKSACLSRPLTCDVLSLLDEFVDLRFENLLDLHHLSSLPKLGSIEEAVDNIEGECEETDSPEENDENVSSETHASHQVNDEIHVLRLDLLLLLLVFCREEGRLPKQKVGSDDDSGDHAKLD